MFPTHFSLARSITTTWDFTTSSPSHLRLHLLLPPTTHLSPLLVKSSSKGDLSSPLPTPTNPCQSPTISVLIYGPFIHPPTTHSSSVIDSSTHPTNGHRSQGPGPSSAGFQTQGENRPVIAVPSVVRLCVTVHSSVCSLICACLHAQGLSALDTPADPPPSSQLSLVDAPSRGAHLSLPLPLSVLLLASTPRGSMASLPDVRMPMVASDPTVQRHTWLGWLSVQPR